MWAFSSQFRVILSYFRAIFEPYLSRFWVVFVLFSSRLLSDKNGLERCGIWKSISKCIFGEIVLFKMLRWQWCQKASDFWNAKYWSTISEIGHQHNQSSTSVSNIDATRWFSRKNWNQSTFFNLKILDFEKDPETETSQIIISCKSYISIHDHLNFWLFPIFSIILNALYVKQGSPGHIFFHLWTLICKSYRRFAKFLPRKIRLLQR